jgi:hypothetical protein
LLVRQETLNRQPLQIIRQLEQQLELFSVFYTACNGVRMQDGETKKKRPPPPPPALMYAHMSERAILENGYPV